MTDANISLGRVKREEPNKKNETILFPVESVDIANPQLLEKETTKQKEKENVATTQLDLIRLGLPTGSRAGAKVSRETRKAVKDYYFNNEGKKYYDFTDNDGSLLSISPLLTGDAEKDQLNKLSNNTKYDNVVKVEVPYKNNKGFADKYTLYWNVGQVWNKEKGIFERIGRTEEEINEGARQLSLGYFQRDFVKSISNPLFNSRPDAGLLFKDLGTNVEAEVNENNTMKGYTGDVGFELAKKDAFYNYSAKLIDFIFGDGLLPIIGNGMFNVLKEGTEIFYGRSRYFGEDKKAFDSFIEKQYTEMTDAVDSLTVGDTWVSKFQNLYADDAEELAKGNVARTPENFQAFTEGNNDYFFLRAGKELVETANVNRAFLKGLDLFGVGPKDAKKFYDELAGLAKIDRKREKHLKKTGFDFYKEEKIANAKATGSLVPSDAKLTKEYNNMAKSTRSHYVNKALGHYTMSKLSEDTSSFFKSTNMLLTQNKFDVGGNLRAYYKGENIFTISETAGYAISSEILTDSPFINTLVALGSGFGGFKYSVSDYARRIRDPKQNVIQRGIKTILNSAVEGSPYTLLDGLLYMVDPLARNRMRLKDSFIGKGRGFKEFEYLGRVEKLKKIDEDKGLKLRDDKYYADKAAEEYGVVLPDEPRKFNYFLMLSNRAKNLGTTTKESEIISTDIDKLITENKKEFKFLEDLAEGINKVEDPIVKQRVIESLREFKLLQTEITRLKSTMKVDLAPGEIHPADKLSTALFSILPLYTTASAVRTMVQNAQAGYMRMINLSEAELLFQNAQTQFIAASDLMRDIVDKTKGGAVGQSISNTINNIQEFLVNEKKLVDTAKGEMDTLRKVMEQSANIDTFTSGRTPLSNMEVSLQMRADDLSMDEIINGKGEIGDSIKAIQEQRDFVYRKTISLLNNLNADYSTRGVKSREVIYETIMNDRGFDLILDGNIIYGSVYRKLKDVNVQGSDVDDLIVKFNDLNRIDESADFYTKTINYNIKGKAVRALNKSLKPFGTELRNRLKTLVGGDLDQVRETIEGLGFKGNMYNESALYEFYVKNIKGKEDVDIDDFESIFKNVYKDYSLSATTLVHMERSFSNRKFALDKKSTLNPNESLELQNINALRNNVMDIFKTKNNIPSDILNEFPLAKERYRKYVGTPKHDTIFTPTVERVDYTQTEDEMIETYDMIRDMKVKKKRVIDEKFPEKRYVNGQAPIDIMFKVGEMLASGDPIKIEKVYKDAVYAFGTEAISTTRTIDASGKEIFERTRVIGNAVDAERINIILHQSVLTYVQSSLQKAMKNYTAEDAASNIPLPAAAQEILKSLQPGGALYNSMRTLEQRSTIPTGFKVWSKKLDSNGKPVMDNSGEWLRSRQSGVISRTEYNLNKPVINFGLFSDKIETPLKQIYQGNKEALRIIDDTKELLMRKKGELGSKVRERTINDAINYESTAAFFSELGIPKSKAANPDQLAEALLEDRTGENIKRLTDFLKEKAANKKYYKIVKTARASKKIEMTKKEAEAEIDDFVQNLVFRGFANKVLVNAKDISRDAPAFTTKRPDASLPEKAGDLFRKRNFFVDKEGGGSYIDEVNKLPDLTKLLEADSEYGLIFRAILPDDQYDKVYAIAKKLSFDKRLLDEAAGVLGNAPTPISIAMVLQRVFNLARGMISVKWVGADAMVRAARLGNADIMRAVLTTRVPLESGSKFQVTAVDVLHDMLVNGNYSEKNALIFGSVFPRVLENAEITFENEQGPNADSYSNAIARGIEKAFPEITGGDLSRLPNINVFQPFVPRFKKREPRRDPRPEIEVQMEDVGLGRDRTIPTGRIKRKEPPRQESFLGSSPTDAATRRKEDRNRQRLETDAVTTADVLKDINI